MPEFSKPNLLLLIDQVNSEATRSVLHDLINEVARLRVVIRHMDVRLRDCESECGIEDEEETAKEIASEQDEYERMLEKKEKEEE